MSIRFVSILQTRCRRRTRGEVLQPLACCTLGECLPLQRPSLARRPRTSTTSVPRAPPVPLSSAPLHTVGQTASPAFLHMFQHSLQSLCAFPAGLSCAHLMLGGRSVQDMRCTWNGAKIGSQQMSLAADTCKLYVYVLTKTVIEGWVRCASGLDEAESTLLFFASNPDARRDVALPLKALRRAGSVTARAPHAPPPPPYRI